MTDEERYLFDLNGFLVVRDGTFLAVSRAGEELGTFGTQADAAAALA